MDYLLSMLAPLWQGAQVTLKLFFITLALALPLGLALALARRSRWAALRTAVSGYLWLMRGTPLMLQMLFIYFALPFVPVVGVRLPDFPAAVLAFALNYAAYFAEIFRAGIEAVDRGQYEAARVLGLNYRQTMRRIVLPQMVRRILPPMSNETITLVKDTSLIYVLALARVSRWKALSAAVNGYIWLMRGTPLMLQMLFIYFALPFVPVIGIRLPDFPAAVVAFALNYAAYFAEIFRAGIQSVDRGQYEAAKVLGMGYGQTMRRIVLPQMVRSILPPMSNETITLVKDTSLIYVLALNDLLRAARGIVQRDFTTTPFIVAAAFYLAMTLLLTWGFQRLEKRYAKYDQ